MQVVLRGELGQTIRRTGLGSKFSMAVFGEQQVSDFPTGGFDDDIPVFSTAVVDLQCTDR